MKNNTLLFVIVGVLILGGLFFAFKPKTQSTQSQSEPGAVMEREAEETEEIKDFTAEKEVTLEIKDYKFTPQTIRIKKGTKVTWINKDVARHNAVADDGSFKTELIGRDESVSVTFDNVGKFGYFCGPHPFMRGTIIVE
jgi:plastocyanin